ncbi:VOC family protein [Streptomyces sp. NPDC005408]|uniref:VOC family protein n=1 Tax=Streptomyces sp. NPDC005408 TaxID=3155341 RepID=UPI0033BC5111
MPRRTGYGPGTPCWTDCVTTDLKGAQDFYAGLFGWEYEDEGPGYRIVSLRGEIIGGIGRSPGGPAGSAWNVYLATKDAEVTRARVLAEGGRVVMGPVSVADNGRLFLAVDPAGAPVGFWEGRRAEGVVLADEPGAVCGTLLSVHRDAQAEQFYGALYGYTADRVAHGRTTLTLGGVPYAELVADPSVSPHWMPLFGAADPTTTVRAALAAGASLVTRPGGGTVLRDPWGAVFGLVEPGR